MSSLKVKNSEKSSKTGKAIKLTPKLAKEICKAVALNPRGLNSLCKERKHWPSSRTIFRWIKNNSEFCNQYKLAKRFQLEMLADEMLKIADDDELDLIEGADGFMVENSKNVEEAQSQINSLKRLFSQLELKNMV